MIGLQALEKIASGFHRRISVDDERDMLISEHRKRREILEVEGIRAGNPVGNDRERRNQHGMSVRETAVQIVEANGIAAARLVDDGNTRSYEALFLYHALE